MGARVCAKSDKHIASAVNVTSTLDNFWISIRRVSQVQFNRATERGNGPGRTAPAAVPRAPEKGGWPRRTYLDGVG